jgi:DNA-binding CsgD family transcriptional regulator
MNEKFKAWQRATKATMRDISAATGIHTGTLYKALGDPKGVIVWIAQCLVDYSNNQLTLDDLHARVSKTKLPSTLPFALTSREFECAHLFNRGLTIADIGQRLGISPRTVESHLAGVGTKTKSANSRAALHKLRILNVITD